MKKFNPEKIWFKIESGEFYEDLDLFTKMDPYCEFNWGKNPHKTDVHV